jgi:hypothetical protein
MQMKATNPSDWDGRDPYKLFPEVFEHDMDVAINLDAARPQEEIDAELKARGLNPEQLTVNAADALKKALR